MTLIESQVKDKETLEKIKEVASLVKQLKKYLQGVGVIDKSGNLDSIQQLNLETVALSVSSEGVGYRDLFRLVDFDNSGSLSKEEFKVAVNRLGYKLSDHRVDEVYAHVDAHNSNLSYTQFHKAIDYIIDKNSHTALNYLGLTQT